MDGGCGGPGSLSLVRLLDEHGAAIYADLRRFYSVDLLAYFRGEMSARAVLALVENLPDDAAVMAALLGGRQAVGWDVHAHILADLVDAVQWNTYVALVQRAKRPGALEKPTPYPRPGKGSGTAERASNPFVSALAGERPRAPHLAPVRASVAIPAVVAERSKEQPEAPPFIVN
ncbi:hypothetical protein [Streptomyces luteoverticillatus]|uniref:hypothetical protein n=1 Tax=Streptomyces luteoverticillatus TaxID=66425 RepID=UPI0013DE94FD|nr:hypothetical protein [Streptomyces luteoverticillatus]